MTRNELIRDAVNKGEIPVLPFELERARLSFSQQISKQEELGRSLGEAMRQSSETWHDNAPAEAIRNESQVAALLADKAIKLLQYGKEFDYETEGNTVSLGSVGDIRYDKTGNIITTLVTGATYDVKDFCGNSDIKGVTIFSPIGKAILDLSVGDSTEVTISNKKIPLSIIRIRNFDELSA